MEFMRNAKIKTKILVAFLSALIMATILNIVGIQKVFEVDTVYSDLILKQSEILVIVTNAKTSLNEFRVNLRAFWVYSDNPDKINEYAANNVNLYNSLLANINSIRAIDVEVLEADKVSSELLRVTNQYYSSVEKVTATVLAGDFTQAVAILENETVPNYHLAIAEFDKFYSHTVRYADDISIIITPGTVQLVITLSILLTALFIITIIIGNVVSNMVTKPLQKLVDVAGKVSNGDFINLQLGSNGKDEVAVLSNAIATVVTTFNSLIVDIEKLTHEVQAEGDIHARIDTHKFKGAYNKVVTGINTLTEDLINDTDEVVNCMMAYGDGNFDVTIKKHVGKKAVLNTVVDNFQLCMRSIANDINRLVKAAATGDLSQRLDPDLYKNDWKNIAKGLNSVLVDVIKPIYETIEVLGKMSQGDLKVRIKGDYKGEYLVMKNVLNQTLGELSKYVDEISYTLTEMSQENFNLDIKTDYIGDFAPIKKALLQIINTFNNVLAEIGSSAEQISSGARQISESSITLAEGAAEQSASVEKLSNIFSITAEQTIKNTEAALSASTLAAETKLTAQDGNKKMNLLLNAMEEINTSSTNIVKIIEVIDSIAFQTNLLALNAAVEAARAGVHGKGFAVVAEEVRSLASRSQNAARDITTLIQGSVEKAAEGRNITSRTAETLHKIVGSITEITTIVGDIAEASQQQRENIVNINKNIGQISRVTQSNTASSEEGASSAEELSNQSELFRNMVLRFKLKKAY